MTSAFVTSTTAWNNGTPHTNATTAGIWEDTPPGVKVNV